MQKEDVVKLQTTEHSNRRLYFSRRPLPINVARETTAASGGICGPTEDCCPLPLRLYTLILGQVARIHASRWLCPSIGCRGVSEVSTEQNAIKPNQRNLKMHNVRPKVDHRVGQFTGWPNKVNHYTKSSIFIIVVKLPVEVRFSSILSIKKHLNIISWY